MLFSPMRPHHGKHGSKVYRTWQNMKNRIRYARDAEKRNYQDRGISICPEWFNSFEAFYAYIGDPPTAKHTLDRIDNDGNYESGNVRWATRSEQQKNRRAWKREYCARGHKLVYSASQKRQICPLCRNERKNARRKVEIAMYGRRLH
jgi:hypothetical protein